MRGMVYRGAWVAIAFVVWLPVWGMNSKGPQHLCDESSAPELSFSVAVQNNAYEVAMMFLSVNGDKVVQAFDMHGLTPLHWAALHGYGSLVELLVRHKADVNTWGTGVRKVMPLHLAVSCGRMSRAWIKGDKVAMYGRKQGDVATYLPIVQALLEAGADPCVGENESAFCYACQAGVPEIVSMLLHCGKLDLETLKLGLEYTFDALIVNEINIAIKAKKKPFSLGLLFE